MVKTCGKMGQRGFIIERRRIEAERERERERVFEQRVNILNGAKSELRRIDCKVTFINMKKS